MRWSVGIEAEGDRVLSREEVVELADAVAAEPRHRHRDRHQPVRRAARRRRRQPRRGDRARPPSEFARGRGARPGCPRRRWCGPRRSARTRTTGHDPARLAGRLPVRGPAAARRLDPARGPRPCTRSCTSPSRTPSRSGTPSSTSATPTTCPPSGSRSGTRARLLDAPGRAPSGRSTSATYEVPGGGRAAPGADRPRADRDLPPGLQRPAVRPGLERRVDRRVLRAHHRAGRPPRPRPGLTPENRHHHPERAAAPAVGSFAARACRGLSVAGRSPRRRAGGTGGCRTRAGRARARPAPRAAG